MIHALTIRGFKRFTSNTFALAPLTVLTGLNGTGKTSLLHALLVAREAASAPEATVALNGPYGLELGTAGAVRNWDADGAMEVELSEGEHTHVWRFEVPADDALHLGVLARASTPPACFASVPRSFTYLSAERLGPRSILGAAALPSSALEVGVRGEYCAQVLEALGNRPPEHPARNLPSGETETTSLLKYQVERWLSEVVRPTELDAKRLDAATTALSFRAPGQDWVRAPNMGFGVTYALPVVLGGLLARDGGMMVVENPEAHLHPAGQSRMGFLLSHLASTGVQIVVETHSDHVLNGIRRAIGEDGGLEAANAIVHYFDSDAENQPRVQSLRFTPSGSISNWPKGFFDQYQIDVSALTRLHRRR